MGGGCSLVPSTDSVEARDGKGEGWVKADLDCEQEENTVRSHLRRMIDSESAVDTIGRA